MLKSGIEHIYNTDYDFQYRVIKAILKEVRHIEDNDILEATLTNLMKSGAFYVIDDKYMITHFGQSITDSKYGIYYNDICKYALRLVLPMILFDGTIGGLIGYTNKNDIDPEDNSFIKYLYPNRIVLNKKRYLYIKPEEYRKAYEEQYICIVDGLFDQHALEINGYNACSLCGSAVTEYHKLYLTPIKHIVIIADNDPAGRKFANSIRKMFPRSIEILQKNTSDIDDFLKTKQDIKKFNDLMCLIKSENFTVNHYL